MLMMLTSPRHHLWNQSILCEHRSIGIEADRLLESIPQTDQRTSPRHQHRHQLILCLHRLMGIKSMVPYYGRHSAKQFVRGKPIRFGFKAWSLNTPLGYCVQMDPYQGDGITDTQLGLGGSVVVKLINALPSDNYALYFDNLYSTRVPLSIRHDGVNHLVVSSGTQRCCVVCKGKTRRHFETEMRRFTASRMLGFIPPIVQ